MGDSGAAEQTGSAYGKSAKLDIRTDTITSGHPHKKTFRAGGSGVPAVIKSYGSKKIVGDVAEPVTVDVDSKLGRVALNLRKAVADRMQIRRNHVSGAMIDFDGGESVVLLSSGSVGSKVVVTRTSPLRVEIAIGTPADVALDEIEATFLEMKTAAFGLGKLSLTPPLSSADWRKSFGQLIAKANAEAEASTRAELEQT